GIKREFSNARTPQHNGVAKRRNRSLIEAARIMLADAKLPDTFWAEAVNTACYVQNRVLVNKAHNKTLYELFNEDSIDSGFARFNTIITSLKALDEGFSSKNYVRKFLRALHPKWRAKVMTIEESKDLSSLVLDELIGNLKVQEVIMEKDYEIYKGKKERIKSITLKAKKESTDDETLTSESDDEEYAMAANGCWDLVVEVVGCSRDGERGGKIRESRVY
nr:putative ribonuclease H-like domain-containing protein [Tanacetum cinerariifolium]